MDAFQWDAANTEHLQRHGVSPEEFEQAMIGQAVDLECEEVEGELRYHTVGATNAGRLLYLVWTMRNQQVRAITAFKAGPLATKAWKERIAP